MFGLIVKSIAGFYSVEAGGTVYVCKPRGLFRKSGETPLVGDQAEFEPGTGDAPGTLTALLARKNWLLRPPLANLDRLFIVYSSAEPSPSTLVIDRMICIAESKKIQPVVVFNKNDLTQPHELCRIYNSVGIPVVSVSCQSGEGLEELRALLSDGINAFTGNTGVGKSSLLNRLNPRLALQTGAISEHLGRGRHTTRHAELFRVGQGYVADTAGFSTVDVEKQAAISKENLPFAFREFLPYLNQCRYTTCSHRTEQGCAVLEAVRQGIISESRHRNYCILYEEAAATKDYQRK